MLKSSTPRSSRVRPIADPTAEVDPSRVDVQQVIRLGLEQFIYQAGLLLVQQVMEAEATQLAGKRYARADQKPHYRHGGQPGSVYLAGQKVRLQKPPVRTRPAPEQPAQEVPLESYRAFSQPEAMSTAVFERLLPGVSCRDYARTVETVVRGHGISKSAVNRKAIATTAQAVEAFYTRKLDTVLATDRQYLFVLDGGKALAKAVPQVFGSEIAIQRSQVHKKRNVLDYLPKEHQERIGKKLTAAWGMKDYSEAHKALMAVHKELELSDSATNSLLEGLEQTLTVHKLGVSSELRRSIASTNTIESMFSMGVVGATTLARHYQRNVKHWQNEKQVERWLVSALLEVEQRLRRVRDYRSLKMLQWKTSLPLLEVVEIDSCRLTRPTPRPSSTSTRAMRSLSERPKRSSRQTTNSSPGRRLSISLSSPGLAACTPLSLSS